jgi:hypothetical protein
LQPEKTLIHSPSVSAGVKPWPDGYASVAQLVEQLTLNQLVHGSSPCRGTTFKARRFIAKRRVLLLGPANMKKGQLSQSEFAFTAMAALLEKPGA